MSDAGTVSRPGLRERSKIRRRRLILHTALRLFAEQGYEQTTINQIADAADVAPRTVTGYFPSKLDFVTEWPVSRSQRMIELFEQHPDADFVGLIDLTWHDARERVDREEAALTRAMAVANPGIAARAEVEAATRIAGPEFSMAQDSGRPLLQLAGSEAVKAINQTFFRGIADDSMTDSQHEALLGLVRDIVRTTRIGHGALAPHS